MDLIQTVLQVGPQAPVQGVSLEQVALVGFGLLMATLAAVFFKRNYKSKHRKDKSEPQEQ